MKLTIEVSEFLMQELARLAKQLGLTTEQLVLTALSVYMNENSR
jgi:hypothetical protein